MVAVLLYHSGCFEIDVLPMGSVWQACYFPKRLNPKKRSRRRCKPTNANTDYLRSYMCLSPCTKALSQSIMAGAVREGEASPHELLTAEFDYAAEAPRPD